MKLNLQQELEHVEYINILTKRGLPLTRKMIQNFASCVAKEAMGEGWVTRFINRHKDHLISHWTAGMDRNRHQADSEANYSLYFDLLESNIAEYDILPENTYSMDEKGLLDWYHRQKQEDLQQANVGEKGSKSFTSRWLS